jgi:hypothetical protein
MADNLVSQLSFSGPIVDSKGLPTRSFAIWIRDVYRRTSYKGGNAIDDNKKVIDGTVDTLEEVIIVVEDHELRITANTEGIQLVAANLSKHESLEQAHNSNGNIVGFSDLAEEETQGLVKKMISIADAIASTVEVTVADASDAPASYTQSHSQELVDLSNANKEAINTLVTDFNNAVTVLNDLIAQSKSSGQMTL